MLPDNLESGWYMRKNDMCGMVCAEWYKCGMVQVRNGILVEWHERNDWNGMGKWKPEVGNVCYIE